MVMADKFGRSVFDTDLFNTCYGVIRAYIVEPDNIRDGTGLSDREIDVSQLERVIESFIN